MRFVRYLFGRSKFSRIDLMVFIGVVQFVDLTHWWLALIILFGWAVVSSACELLVFGEGYHKLSDDAQHIAEHSK